MKKRVIRVIIALLLFLLALCIPFTNEWINKGIYIISYIIVGLPIVLEAIRNILKGKVFDENFLMSIATIGAFIIGEFPEAVAVMLFYQVGELFQSYAVDKSRKSIASVMNIRPDFANIKRGEQLEKLDPSEVQIGDTIIIKPGEKIPLDGIVIEGQSMVDTSALTGESVPRSVKEGDEILSGCINGQGLLSVKVTKEFGESTVSKILDLVENASSRKSKSENFITKFAKYYTPIVVIIAVLLAILPPMLIPNAQLTDWVYRALSFLVVSCPCALVISIPLGFFGGIGGASKCGILVKGSNYLEALSQAEIVVFDKTGTLTEGVFEVQKIETEGITKEELLKMATYAESFSNHPISLSLKRAYQKEIEKSQISYQKKAKNIDDFFTKEVEKLHISSTKEISGRGVEAVVENKQVLVGNDKLMKQYHINYKECQEIGTILYVAIDGKFVGTIVIADKIKQDAKKAVQDLKKNHIQKTVMLTGDKKAVAEAVAKKLEIDIVYAELLPDGKVEKVEELLKNKTANGKLVFAGDGINDAPVLALSDIGVAMGGVGSDAAIEAADIVIMTDEPSKISKAIQIAKKTMRIVHENIYFAIIVKILVLILTAIGVVSMWWAVFADVGVSVIAILNSLRMLNMKS